MAGASVRCEITSRRATNRRMPDAMMRSIRCCRMWIFLRWCLKHELLTNRDQFAVCIEIRMAGPRDSFPEDALHHRDHGVVIALLDYFRFSKRRRKKERRKEEKNVSSPFKKVIYCSPVQQHRCMLCACLFHHRSFERHDTSACGPYESWETTTCLSLSLQFPQRKQTQQEMHTNFGYRKSHKSTWF